MNFLYTINDNFVPQLGAGLTSICENNQKEAQITFYIMSFGISSQNKNQLKCLAQKYNRSIIFIEISDIKQYFDFDIDKCKEYIAMRNPKAEVIPISAKTGEGMKEWTEWLKKHVAEWKQ